MATRHARLLPIPEHDLPARRRTRLAALALLLTAFAGVAGAADSGLLILAVDTDLEAGTLGIQNVTGTPIDPPPVTFHLTAVNP